MTVSLRIFCGWGKLQSYRVSEFQSYRVTEFQSCRVTELRSFRVAELQSCRVSELQSYRVSELESFRVAKFAELQSYNTGHPHIDKASITPSQKSLRTTSLKLANILGLTPDLG